MSLARTEKAVEAIYAEVEKQTDRGAAIIAAAILEEFLTEALKKRLILSSSLSKRLFEQNGLRQELRRQD